MVWTRRLKSGKYYGCFRAGGKKDLVRDKFGKPVKFTQQAEAKRRAFAAERQACEPGAVAPGAGKMTWGEWREEWWANRKTAANTRYADTYRVKNQLAPRWDSEPLDSIQRDDIQTWVDELPVAPSNVHVCYALFSNSMRIAVKERKIGATPCVEIALPVIPPSKIHDMYREEYNATLANLTGHGRMLAQLLVGTGMRWEEGAGLHIDDLDLRRKNVHIWQVFSRRGNHIKPCPKSQKPRTVPLPEWLVKELRDWLKRYPPAQHCGTEHLLPGTCRSGLVIPWERGTCLPYEHSRRLFCRAVRAARLVDDDDLVPIRYATLHNLRDTYASWLLQDGIPIEAISELLGHASIEMTKKRYAQFGDRRFDQVRDVLDGVNTAPILPHGPSTNVIPIDFQRRSGA